MELCDGYFGIMTLSVMHTSLIIVSIFTCSISVSNIITFHLMLDEKSDDNWTESGNAFIDNLHDWKLKFTRRQKQ